MELETTQIGIALASYVAGMASNWWWANRKKITDTIEETLEDKIEEAYQYAYKRFILKE